MTSDEELLAASSRSLSAPMARRHASQGSGNRNASPMRWRPSWHGSTNVHGEWGPFFSGVPAPRSTVRNERAEEAQEGPHLQPLPLVPEGFRRRWPAAL